MSTSHRVLIPFDLPGADPVPSVLMKPLATTEAVALGHHELPEQPPPGTARGQFERDTREELADLLAGADASVTLFHAAEETLAGATDRPVEQGCDPGRIYRRLSERSDVGQRVIELGAECDLFVVDEPNHSRALRVLEPRSTETALSTDDPAFIIRGPDRS